MVFEIPCNCKVILAFYSVDEILKCGREQGMKATLNDILRMVSSVIDKVLLILILRLGSREG